MMQGVKDMAKRALIIVYSYHHNNTLKVAETISKVLDAEIKEPEDVEPNDIPDYDLIGFGSGIYGADLHGSIHKLIDGIQNVNGIDAFIFSTEGSPAKLSSDDMKKDKMKTDHKKAREKLLSKGFKVINEYSCPGFNTNSFIKYFGGLNKGRPNKEDIERAGSFARSLLARS